MRLVEKNKNKSRMTLSMNVGENVAHFACANKTGGFDFQLVGLALRQSHLAEAITNPSNVIVSFFHPKSGTVGRLAKGCGGGSPPKPEASAVM